MKFIFSLLGKIKLTAAQYLFSASAAVIFILSMIIKSKNKEIRKKEVAILKAKSDIAIEKHRIKSIAGGKKATNSVEKYREAKKKYEGDFNESPE